MKFSWNFHEKLAFHFISFHLQLVLHFISFHLHGWEWVIHTFHFISFHNFRETEVLNFISFHFISFHFGREMKLMKQLVTLSLHFFESQESRRRGNARKGTGSLRQTNRSDWDQTGAEDKKQEWLRVNRHQKTGVIEGKPAPWTSLQENRDTRHSLGFSLHDLWQDHQPMYLQCFTHCWGPTVTQWRTFVNSF